MGLKMTELDKAFERLLLWKAKKIRRGSYQEEVGILQPDDRFKVGAVDAMVFDIASLVGFTSKTKEHLDWTAYPVWEHFLAKIFGHSPASGFGEKT